MEEQKISNQKLLYWILGLFFTVFAGIATVAYLYFSRVKELFEQSLNQKMCIENLDIQKISYESFISQHYQIQSDWITFWLAFTGIVLTLVTIIMPIIAIKNNEKQEEKLEKQEKKFDEICKEAKESIEKSKMSQKVTKRLQEHMVNQINKHKQLMFEDVKKYEKERNKDLEEVIEYVDKAKNAEKLSKINSLNSEALNLEMQCMYTKAIEKYTEVLSLDPINKIALNNTGVSFVKLKKYKDAIDKLSYLISIYNDDYVAYYNLSEAYLFDNQINEAIINLEKYKQYGGKNILKTDSIDWKNKINSLTSLEQKNKLNEIINSLEKTDNRICWI